MNFQKIWFTAVLHLFVPLFAYQSLFAADFIDDFQSDLLGQSPAGKQSIDWEVKADGGTFNVELFNSDQVVTMNRISQSPQSLSMTPLGQEAGLKDNWFMDLEVYRPSKDAGDAELKCQSTSGNKNPLSLVIEGTDLKSKIRDKNNYVITTVATILEDKWFRLTWNADVSTMTFNIWLDGVPIVIEGNLIPGPKTEPYDSLLIEDINSIPGRLRFDNIRMTDSNPLHMDEDPSLIPPQQDLWFIPGARKKDDFSTQAVGQAPQDIPNEVDWSIYNENGGTFRVVNNNGDNVLEMNHLINDSQKARFLPIGDESGLKKTWFYDMEVFKGPNRVELFTINSGTGQSPIIIYLNGDKLMVKEFGDTSFVEKATIPTSQWFRLTIMIDEDRHTAYYDEDSDNNTNCGTLTNCLHRYCSDPDDIVDCTRESRKEYIIWINGDKQDDPSYQEIRDELDFYVDPVTTNALFFHGYGPETGPSQFRYISMSDHNPLVADHELGVAEEVMEPWTDVVRNGKIVSIWNRSYELNEQGLIDRINNGGQRQLISGMKLEADDINGVPIPYSMTNQAVSSDSPEEASIFTQGMLGSTPIDIWTKIEYDGMVRFDVTIDGTQNNLPVQSFDLRIPLPESLAKYLHYIGPNLRNGASDTIEIPEGVGTVWSSFDVTNNYVKNSFLPMIWLGTEDLGLAWFAESDQYWLGDKETTPAFTIERDVNSISLLVHLARNASGLSDRRTITFGIHPTPVKPLAHDWREWQRWYSYGTSPTEEGNYFLFRNSPDWASGYFSLEPYKPLEKITEGTRKNESLWDQNTSWHANNKKVMYYTCMDLLNFGDAASRDFYDMWNYEDSESFHGDNVGVNNGQGCLLCTRYNILNSTAPDPNRLWHWKRLYFEPSLLQYRLYAADRTIKLTDVDGLYIDNIFMRGWFNSIGNMDKLVQKGIAYYCEECSPPDYVPIYPIFLYRDFMKRLAHIHYDNGKSPFIYLHATNTMLIPVFSFAQVMMGGEDCTDCTVQEWDLFYNAAKKKVEFTSRPWGVVNHWFWENEWNWDGSDNWDTDYYLGQCAIHDAGSFNAKNNSDLFERYDAYRESKTNFGLRDGEHIQWYPYWSNSNNITVSSPDLSVSFYYNSNENRPGKKILMAVLNTSDNDIVDGTITINTPEEFNLGSSINSAIDGSTDTAISFTGYTMDVSLRARRFIWIEID